VGPKNHKIETKRGKGSAHEIMIGKSVERGPRRGNVKKTKNQPPQKKLRGKEKIPGKKGKLNT